MPGTNIGKEEDVPDEDTGALPVRGEQKNMDFALDTSDAFLLDRKCSCKITDHLYNAFRAFLRESVEMELALRIEYEKGSLKVAEDIIPELSGVNFNPVLNRRVVWELKNLLQRKKTMFVNSNYIFPNEEIVQALRANI